jgi:hypothetical protein
MRGVPLLFCGLIFLSAQPSAAWAQQLRSTNQMPGLIDLDSTKVAIANLGTADLSIQYLDGTWKTVQIPSGKYVSLPSPAGGVSVSFNDGVEAKSALLNGNSAYALYWNTGVGRWAIAPYDEVAKRPSSLRAR